MSRLVGIGFVGAGMVADLHAAAIARSPQARLVGFFDPDPAVATRKSEAWSSVAYPSLDAMLSSEEIEAVFVLSPTQHHVAHARLALEAGKHVLVEKPVSRVASDIVRLAAYAKRRGLLCIPGHNYAYIPEYQRIKRLVAEGVLGTIRLAAVMFAIAHTEEVARHYDGVTWLVMPHHAYLVYGLLGMPRSVTAGVTQPAWEHLDREDQGWIVLDYPPHGTAMLFTTLGANDDAADPWSFVVKVVGTNGSASLSWRTAVTHDAKASMSMGWAAYEEAYERELAAVVAAVAGDPSLVASQLDDAVAVARIIAAAEASARRGRTITLTRPGRESRR